MQCLYLLALLVAALLPVSRGGIFAGYTVGRQFQYIGKFCFSWTPTLDDIAGVRTTKAELSRTTS
jgi:hypothetical protein